MAEIERNPIAADSEIDSKLSQLADAVNKAVNSDDDLVTIGDAVGGDEGVPYWILTGIPALDFAVGGVHHPGFPGARFIEIFGAEGTGKSTLALWLMRQAIEQLNAVAYHQDVERVLTPEIIHGTGINMKRVMRDQPDILEQVFDKQIALLEAIGKDSTLQKQPVIIITDSVAAASTKAEVEADMDKVGVAEQARLMSKGLRKLKSPVTKSQVMSLWVNQTREKMNTSWGDNVTTPGGKALPFYSSVRIYLTRIQTLKKTPTSDPYGCRIKAVIKKNKVAPPLRTAEYDILFMQDDSGSYPVIDVTGAMIDYAVSQKSIPCAAGYYTWNGSKYRRDMLKEIIMGDEEQYEQLRKLCYEGVTPSD